MAEVQRVGLDEIVDYFDELEDPRCPGPAATKVLPPYALAASGSRKRPENSRAINVNTFGAMTLVCAGPATLPHQSQTSFGECCGHRDDGSACWRQWPHRHRALGQTQKGVSLASAGFA